MFTRRSPWLFVALAVRLALPLRTGAGGNDDSGGRVEGAWDLPANDREPGWLAGWLIPKGSDEPRFYYEAELRERYGPLESRFGPTYGWLYDLTAPSGEP